jgi:hypothetical protein
MHDSRKEVWSYAAILPTLLISVELGSMTRKIQAEMIVGEKSLEIEAPPLNR